MDSLKMDSWTSLFKEDELNKSGIIRYLTFIEESFNKKYDSDTYVERHHIIPKSLDICHQYDKERVTLSGSDHFIAHKLLVECFIGDKRKKMSYALTKMIGHTKDFITPEDYEYARRVQRDALLGNKNALGLVHSEESRKKMSEHHYKKASKEHCDAISKSLIGHSVSEETRKKLREANIGKTISKETKEKISKAVTGRIEITDGVSERYIKDCDKIPDGWYKGRALSNIEKVLGEKNPMYGKHHSEESRKKMSESRRGNQYARGNIWITNGIDNKIIRDINLMPKGWHRGRTISKGDKNE